MTARFELSTQVRVIRRGQFQQDAALRDRCLELATASYENPSALLNREWTKADTLYLAYNSTRLEGFYLARFDIIDTIERWLPTMYLGLSATAEEARGHGIGNILYAHGLIDAFKWQAHEGAQIILWATTATPVVYLRLLTGLHNANPLMDGSYSTDGAALAAAIARELRVVPPPTGHPFVLKGIAQDTRYSPREVQRLVQLSAETKCTLFADLDIDEAQGDRPLVVAQLPSWSDDVSGRARRIVSAHCLESGS